MAGLLALVAVLVFGFVAAHRFDEWARQRLFLRFGVAYALLGLLAGPLVMGAVSERDLERLLPMASLLTGLLGLQLGTALPPPREPGPRGELWGAGLVYGGVALGVLGAVTWGALTYALPQLGVGLPGLAGAPKPAAGNPIITGAGHGVLLATVALATAGLAASAHALHGLSERLRAAGPVLEATSRLARHTQVLAVVVFGVCMALWDHTSAAGLGELTSVEWVVVNLAIGAALGVTFHLFVGRDLDEHRLLLALLGVAAFASGVAELLHLSSIFMNFIVGLVLARLGGRPGQVGAALTRVEKPVYVLLLLFAGALWRPPTEPVVYVLAGAFVVVRFAALGVAGRAAAAQLELKQPGATRLGFTLVGQTPLTIAIAVGYTLAVPQDTSGLVLTAVLASVLLNDLWANFMAQSVLDDAGENPDTDGRDAVPRGGLMRTIICGLGDVGRHLAVELAALGHDITVIDRSPSVLADLEHYADVMTMQGDVAVPATLEAANAKDADLVVAVSDNDQTNLVAALLAKQMGAHHTVARLGNRAYFADRTGWAEGLLDVDLVLCPGLLAGCEVVRLSRAAYVGHVENFAGNLVQIMAPVVAEGSRAAGSAAGRLPLPRGCRALAVIRDGESHTPDAITRLHPDDRVVLSGSPAVLVEAEGLFEASGSRRHHAVVVGGGDMGSSVAVELMPIMHSVTLTEVDEAVCETLAGSLHDVHIARGDGTSVQFLTDLGVARADLLVAATGSDEVNLMGALLSKQLGVGQVIALLHRPDYLSVYSALGIDYSVSPLLLVAHEVVRFVQRKRGVLQRRISFDQSAILEVQIHGRSPIIGRRLLDLDLPTGAAVAGLTRGTEVVAEPELTELAANDVLVMYAPERAIEGTRRALVRR